MAATMYATSLDLTHRQGVHSNYKYAQVLPVQSQINVPLSTGFPYLEYEIISNVGLNFAKSYFETVLQVATPLSTGTGGNNVTTTIIPTLGVPFLQRVSLYTRSGLYLCDIDDVDRYCATVLPYVTSESKLMERDTPKMTAGASIIQGSVTPLGPPTGVVMDISPNLAAGILQDSMYGSIYMGSPGIDYITGGAELESNPCALQPMTTGYDPTAIAGNPTPLTDVLVAPPGPYPWLSQVPITDISQMIRVSALAAPAYAVGPQVRYRIPFTAFAHSILAMDKDILCGQVLVLRFTFQNASFISQRATSTAAFGPPITGLAGNVTGAQLINPYIQLARVVDVDVQQSLIKELQSGKLSYIVPYVTPQKVNVAAGSTMGNNQLRLNYGVARSFQRAYNVAFPNTTISATRLCHNNSQYNLADTLYTTLNQTRLQDQNITTVDGVDFKYQQEMIRGSAVQGRRGFNAVWAWIDNFSVGRSCEWTKNDDLQVKSGIGLDTEQLYNIYYQNNSAATVPMMLYSFLVGQKLLEVTSTTINFT